MNPPNVSSKPMAAKSSSRTGLFLSQESQRKTEQQRAHHAAAAGDSFGTWQLIELTQQGEWTAVGIAIPTPHRSEAEAKAAGPDTMTYRIKFARTDVSAPACGAKLISREAALLHAFDEPHIVSLLDADIENEQPYFVMPEAGETTLADTRRFSREGRNEPLSLSDCLWFSRQAAEALNALHQAGWCHFDVKPHNFVVNHQGHVTLVDLAVAQRIGTPLNSLPISGTNRYLAPERRVQRGSVQPSSDVYSFGIVLLELLMGESSHANEEDKTIHRLEADAWHRPFGLCRIERGELLRLMRPELPLPLRKALDASLASLPERRPTLASLIELLSRSELATLHIR